MLKKPKVYSLRNVMKNDSKETKSLALVDNDPTLYNELEEQQNFERNYFWRHFKKLDDFIQEAQSKVFDLVIFNQPKSEQKSVEKFSISLMKLQHVPTIVLFSKNAAKDYNTKDDNLESLTFIEKPFRFVTLVEIMNEKFKFQEKSKFLTIVIGPYFLKPFEKVILDNFGEELFLTDTEVKIVKILSKYEGGFVRKELVMEKVWGIKKFLETHTLETHIYRLRKKIQKKFNEDLWIKSEKGRYALGYKS